MLLRKTVYVWHVVYTIRDAEVAQSARALA